MSFAVSMRRHWRLVLIPAAIMAGGGLAVWFLRTAPPPEVYMTVKSYGRAQFPSQSGQDIAADVQFTVNSRRWLFLMSYRREEVDGQWSTPVTINPRSMQLGPGKGGNATIAFPEGTRHWMANLVAATPNFKLRAQRWLERFLPNVSRLLGVPRVKAIEGVALESDPIEIMDGTNGLPRIYRLHPIPAPKL